MVNGTEYIGCSVVPKEVTKEIVRQLEPDLRKNKRNRTLKDFGPEFLLYLIKGTRDEVSDQHSYCFNVEDDPKAFDEAIKSHDVAFWKEAINDEMDSIMGNNTWVLADLPACCKWILKRKLKVDRTIEKFKARLVIQDFKQKSRIDYFDTYAPVARIGTIKPLIAMASIHNLIIHQMDVKTTFLNGDLDEEVDMTKVFLSSRFSIKDMGEADVILGIRIKHESNRIAIYQSYYIEKYSRVIDCLMYAMTCTRADIAFVMGKLSRYTINPGTQHLQAIQRVLKYLKKTMDYRLTYTGYPSVLEGYTDASWISNTEDNSSTSGWVFLLGGGAISWASKKQTCITGSTMESEFVALAAAGKEAEWLKNLLLEIPLWSKPIAPISIRCDSAATLAKAYSQMYNGKSRHLGVRHNMIRELITNGVPVIKHESNRIAISQSYYIEKVVSQLECSRVIDCLMYVITYTRPDIAFTMGKLSRYTSNPGTRHWQAIQRVLKYLKKTMDYRLTYTGYPSVLEGYTDASWTNNTKDNSSTSGWAFLFGSDAISWAFKKQTCISGSTMESEFVALPAASEEAKWLKNFLLEIPLWVKPITPISIRCDSVATLKMRMPYDTMGVIH
ncbi:zinc finger, CCHC-type containing protein [Tanacetum coccineum]